MKNIQKWEIFYLKESLCEEEFPSVCENMSSWNKYPTAITTSLMRSIARKISFTKDFAIKLYTI